VSKDCKLDTRDCANSIVYAWNSYIIQNNSIFASVHLGNWYYEVKLFFRLLEWHHFHLVKHFVNKIFMGYCETNM